MLNNPIHFEITADGTPFYRIALCTESTYLDAWDRVDEFGYGLFDADGILFCIMHAERIATRPFIPDCDYILTCCPGQIKRLFPELADKVLGDWDNVTEIFSCAVDGRDVVVIYPDAERTLDIASRVWER